jgi:nucleoside-diphosphate-sugar epimerase
MSGSGGLLGTAFSKARIEGISISKTLGTANLPLEEIEIEFSRFGSQGIETFLHLGWPASSYPNNYRESKANFVALEKTLAIRRACEREGINFVGIGSVLDKTPSVENLYSLTKYVAREVLSDDIERGLITWVRPFFIFDEQGWPRFAHAPKEDEIEVLNDSPRDFIHLDDVIAGLAAVIREEIRGEVDLGSGVLRRPSELVAALGHRPIVRTNIRETASTVSSAAASPNSHLAGMWQAKKTTEFFEGSK